MPAESFLRLYHVNPSGPAMIHCHTFRDHSGRLLDRRVLSLPLFCLRICSSAPDEASLRCPAGGQRFVCRTGERTGH